ncbi:MAG: adenine phosphoribosyltransferase [candidate division Zixibacteria bacterium]|jgi:adenine phosphoribosyltransferase|nr:adenine phosphoribosyltransferase [candidate division Zixibacteria bacterium]
MEYLKSYIREVPDFPKKGILFYDITTLMENPTGFKTALDEMEKYVRSVKADKIVAIESRGFIFGAALADRLALPFVSARKPGKLPARTISQEYALEYGTDRLEMHADSVNAGERVVVVDDLIATGGTLKAVCAMVERLGGEVAGISSVIALTFLPFEATLSGYDLNYLISYDSE